MLGSRKLGLDNDAREHRAWHGTEKKIAFDPLLGAPLPIHRRRAPDIAALGHADDLASQPRLGAQARRERRREPVGAADDLIEALRPHFQQLLAQMLGGRGRKQRFRALRHGKKLDRLVR